MHIDIEQQGEGGRLEFYAEYAGHARVPKKEMTGHLSAKQTSGLTGPLLIQLYHIRIAEVEYHLWKTIRDYLLNNGRWVSILHNPEAFDVLSQLGSGGNSFEAHINFMKLERF
jgi:hypothetical protein